ncbi:MAG: PTS sugar transporter subunit IIB [Gemmatimonadota bacterium]|nr:PTS sugar transporter subunit IIB [Gemmatimonadota bacterium]
MPIVLFRVDERLIHGQVVVGWGGPLHADRIVVVDDAIAASAWEQELYCLGVPPEIETTFVATDEARRLLGPWGESARRTVVLMRDLGTATRVAAEGALTGADLNLGGIHHAPGRERVLPYLFLSESERRSLRALVAEGVKVSARDLPGTRAVSIEELLEAP